MITIYFDFHQIKQIKSTNNIIAVSKIQDYVSLRQWLRRAIDEADNDYEVYIQHPMLEYWLRDLRAYNPHVITWTEIRLDAYFEQRFGFPPPNELGETAQRYLINTLQPTDDKTIADPIGWILSSQIDPVWNYLQPNKQHLVILAASILRGKAIPSEFLAMTKKRISQWADQDGRYQIFLKDVLKEAAKKIFLRWVLRNYPANSIVDKSLDIVPLEDCSQYIDICIEHLKKYDPNIKDFWLSRLNAYAEPDIIKILDSMSGLADAELDTIDTLAKQHIEQLTSTLVENIKMRFSQLSQTKSITEKLERIVPPLPPGEPTPTWSVEQWLDWITDDYMPYFAWVLRTKQNRDRQMQLAHYFEEWLINNYSQLPHNIQAPFSPHQLDNIKEPFKTHSVDVIFWFIIDGMTWWQGQKLKEFCAELNINSVQIQPTISVLPTITEISKRALVNGYLDSSKATQPIVQVLRNRLAKEVENIQIFTQSSELEHVYSKDLMPGLYALLYNSLDHHCHTVQGFTDDESINGHLRLIARLIKEGFERCIKQGLRPKAFINSDHGSTLLPEKTTVLKIPQFAYMLENDDNVMEIPFEDRIKPLQRTRVCATNEIPSKDDIGKLSQDWYYLQKDMFNLPQQFFIPKGYSAIERRSSGWTHGGATPEEVVVASLELQPSLDELMKPVLSINGYLRPGKTNKLMLKLRNANRFPIKITQLSMSGISTDIKFGKIKPDAFKEVEVEAQAISNQTSQQITWHFLCEGGGQNKRFEGSENIPIRRLHVSAIDDMFEGM